MQTMHRRFGKLMKRSADESHVSVLLNDYDNADKLLSQVRWPSGGLFAGNCLDTI